MLLLLPPLLRFLRLQPPSEEISSLHDAAKWDDVEAAKRLLDSGADVNALVSAGFRAVGHTVQGYRHRCEVQGYQVVSAVQSGP